MILFCFESIRLEIWFSLMVAKSFLEKGGIIDLSRTIESWMDGHVGATYSTQSSDRQGYELYMVLVNIL